MDRLLRAAWTIIGSAAFYSTWGWWGLIGWNLHQILEGRRNEVSR